MEHERRKRHSKPDAANQRAAHPPHLPRNEPRCRRCSHEHKIRLYLQLPPPNNVTTPKQYHAIANVYTIASQQ